MHYDPTSHLACLNCQNARPPLRGSADNKSQSAVLKAQPVSKKCG